MASYLDYNEPMLSTTHIPRPLPVHLAVHYRQLVSCAVTRQLLDPSIGDESSCVEKESDVFAAWEMGDRMIARERVRNELIHLGIPWDKFRLDVEKVQQEPHILTPTYYDGFQNIQNGNMMTNKVKSRDAYEESHIDLGKTQNVLLTTGTGATKMSLESQMQNLRDLSKLRR